MKFSSVICQLSVLVLFTGCASDALLTPYEQHPSLEAADHAYGRGDLPQAIQKYRLIIKNSQDPCEQAYVGLGRALLDSNAVDDAKRTFDKAIGLLPCSAPAYVGLGDVYLTTNQPENAIKAFNDALRLLPCHAKALNGKGIVHDMMGKHGEARTYYRAAIKADPDSPSYKSNLALSLCFDGDIQEAISILESLVSQKPSPRIRQNLSLAYGLAGDMERAKKIGMEDLSEDIVKNNISYINSIKKSKKYSGLISREGEPPLSSQRKWQQEK